MDSADASVVMMNTTLQTIGFSVDHLRILFNFLKDSNVACKGKILLGSSSHLKIQIVHCNFVQYNYSKA